MNILAFDTSASACSVALQVGEDIQIEHIIAPKQQARLILPMIQSLMQKKSMTFNEIDALTYCSGPGSFTGIRLATSIAQGVSFATRIPIIQVSSLAAIAQTAFLAYGYTHALVAIDARMEQVYWASYEVAKGEAVALNAEGVYTPEKIPVTGLQGVDWVGLGDGWEQFEERLMLHLKVQPRIVDISHTSMMAAILQLAKSKFNRGGWIEADIAIPEYLR